MKLHNVGDQYIHAVKANARQATSKRRKDNRMSVIVVELILLIYNVYMSVTHTNTNAINLAQVII